MVRTRRYIYSPREGNNSPRTYYKEKRQTLLDVSRNLNIEVDKMSKPLKKKSRRTKKADKLNLNEPAILPEDQPLPITPVPIKNNKSSTLNSTIKKRKKLPKKRLLKNVRNTPKNVLNRSIKQSKMDGKKLKSNEKSHKHKKRKHSFETSSETVSKRKKRKIEPFFTSTPINSQIIKKCRKRKRYSASSPIKSSEPSVYNPDYHLNETLKLPEQEVPEMIDLMTPTTVEVPKTSSDNESVESLSISDLPEFITLSETPRNQHLSVNIAPNIYKQSLKMPDIIEIDDDDDDVDEVPQNIDCVNLVSINGQSDDDSVIIIEDNLNKSTATSMTPKPMSNNNDVIEIGTQMTPRPFRNTVATNTSSITVTNIIGTKSVQTINNNVMTQSTNTSILQISRKNVTNNGPQKLTPHNFNFQNQTPNGVISDFVKRIKNLEDQFIKHSLLPPSETTKTTNPAAVSQFGSNIYNPTICIKRGLRLVVIDGSNVAMGHTNGKHFSCEGLKICIDYFIKRGHEVKAFVPQYRRQHHQSTNPKLLEQLAKLNLVIFTPSRQVYGRMIIPYDDRYIVQCAAERGGVIVSNDNYRDLLAENPAWRDTIARRLLMWTWCGDMIMFPIDPCGRGGPSLDEFLRF